MKNLKEHIFEQLIVERIIDTLNYEKVKINIDNHGEIRQGRENQDYATKPELCYSIYKVITNIKDDIEIGKIHHNDQFTIIDTSRKTKFFIPCILDLNQCQGYIVVKIKTSKYDNNFKPYKTDKLYKTNTSDNYIKSRYKTVKLI